MNIALWIVQILLALTFLFAGTAKFLMPADEMAANMPPYLSIGFIYFIGVCEILGGLGLVLPWALKIKPGLTPLAAALLFVIMIGAVVISAAGGIAFAIFPAVVGLLCAFVAWGRKGGSRS
ncbi:MAG: DoxX family protein [Acidobacteriota bacterium]